MGRLPELPGYVYLLAIIMAAAGVIRLLNPPPKVGDALLKTFTEQYTVVGQRVVEREVQGFNSRRREPALFLYLLQDRANPRRYLLSVSQTHGFSIGRVEIAGSAVPAPLVIEGDGAFWGDRVSSTDPADKAYEKEIIINSATGRFLDVSVTYHWIARSTANTFANGRATLSERFSL